MLPNPYWPHSLGCPPPPPPPPFSAYINTQTSPFCCFLWPAAARPPPVRPGAPPGPQCPLLPPHSLPVCPPRLHPTHLPRLHLQCINLLVTPHAQAPTHLAWNIINSTTRAPIVLPSCSPPPMSDPPPQEMAAPAGALRPRHPAIPYSSFPPSAPPSPARLVFPYNRQ